MKIEDFEITEGQKKAFKNVVKAMKKAKELGLSFYGKQWSLYAYRADAMEFACDQDKSHNMDLDNEVPHVCECILADSGADDMEYFPKGFITED